MLRGFMFGALSPKPQKPKPLRVAELGGRFPGPGLGLLNNS